MMPPLFNGIAYVAAVFAAGFVLGVLRTLVLVPLLGACRTQHFKTLADDRSA